MKPYPGLPWQQTHNMLTLQFLCCTVKRRSFNLKTGKFETEGEVYGPDKPLFSILFNDIYTAHLQ